MMKNEIKKIIEAVFCEFKFREMHKEEWALILKHTKYAPCEYLNEYIDFANEIKESKEAQVFDLSLLIKEKSTVIGLWRLHCLKKSSLQGNVSYEFVVYPPILISNLSPMLARATVKKCISTANLIAKHLSIDLWMSHDFFQNSVGLSLWYRESINNSAGITGLHDLYINLTSSYADIKSQIRGSYRSMLGLGDKFQLGVLSGSKNEIIWRDFKNLHLEASGRKTRSDQSWDMQYKSIVSGTGFLIYIYDKEKMMAGSFFYTTLHECMYGVAAYSRDNKKSNFGHVSLNAAIRVAQDKGLLWCRLGEINFESEPNALSNKERAIEFFKKGFATDLMKRYKLTHASN